MQPSLYRLISGSKATSFSVMLSKVKHRVTDLIGAAHDAHTELNFLQLLMQAEQKVWPHCSTTASSNRSLQMRHVRSLFITLFTVRETRSPADSPMFEEASLGPAAAKPLGDFARRGRCCPLLDSCACVVGADQDEVRRRCVDDGVLTIATSIPDVFAHKSEHGG